MKTPQIDTDTYGQDGQHERNDCVVRALSVAACVPYQQAHDIYAKLGRVNKRRLGLTQSRTPMAIRKALGLSQRDSIPEILRPGTIGRFLTENGRQGHWIVTVRGHQLAIVDGVIYDWSISAHKTRRIIRRAYRVL